MKALTLFVFLFSFLMCGSVNVAAIGSKSDLVEISHAHNRLYFSRLHEKELPDSVLRRNIIKAEVVLRQAEGQTQHSTTLLIEKSKSEASYLAGILAMRKHDLENALIMLDAAASWRTVVTNADIPDSLADLTFINSESIARYRIAIRTLRRNVLKMMVEDVYKTRNNQSETAAIEQVKKIREILVAEIPGGSLGEDDSVERIYAYLMLNYNSKRKICNEILIYYEILGNGIFETPHLRRSINATPRGNSEGNQFSQIEAETTSAPVDYWIEERPSDIEIDASLKLARENCPELFKNRKELDGMQMARAAMSKEYADGMLLLPKIPYTKSAWNKIPVNVDRFKNLGALDRFLDSTLRKRDYDNFKYYAFEDGFAIITPIEKFNKNGAVYQGEGRFSMDMNTSINSFFDYVNRLFLADKGHYRFIILAVASKPYRLGARPTLNYLETLFDNGNNRLSGQLAEKPLTKAFSIDGYVYEFEQNEYASDPIFVKEPALTGKQHIAPLIHF